MGSICSEQQIETKEIILNSKQQSQLYKWNRDQKQYECRVFDQKQFRWSKFKFQIEFRQDKEIIYIIDDQIVRIDKLYNLSGEPDILTNLEQINHLNWSQQLNQNNKKVIKQTASWQGLELKLVGGYYIDRQKQGIWKLISKNYCSKAISYELGEYFNGQKYGIWKYLYEDKNMNLHRFILNGCGNYREEGKKYGKWIEMSDGFWDFSQVTYQGEYKNDKKVGYWDCYCKFGEKNHLIGCGLYDYKIQGDSLKNGMWVEISEGFWDMSQVTYVGQYKQGNKVGRWNTYQSYNQYKQMIGGGSYQNQINGTSTKNGSWIELSEGFWMSCQVLYEGQYKNGKKVGRWDIWFSSGWKKKTKLIGGGQYYDEVENDEIKIGNWIELSHGFREESQITYQGEYKNGQKVGRWNIIWNNEGNNQKIGGGFYMEQLENRSVKDGNWIEISDEFSDTFNGKKVGKWFEMCLGFNWQKEIKYD